MIKPKFRYFLKICNFFKFKISLLLWHPVFRWYSLGNRSSTRNLNFFHNIICFFLVDWYCRYHVNGTYYLGQKWSNIGVTSDAKFVKKYLEGKIWYGGMLSDNIWADVQEVRFLGIRADVLEHMTQAWLLSIKRVLRCCGPCHMASFFSPLWITTTAAICSLSNLLVATFHATPCVSSYLFSLLTTSSPLPSPLIVTSHQDQKGLMPLLALLLVSIHDALLITYALLPSHL